MSAMALNAVAMTIFPSGIHHISNEFPAKPNRDPERLLIDESKSYLRICVKC